MHHRPEDRTAKAIIRDTAIELFGRNGPDGVPLRRIAEAAGVSQALIIRHYGSREGLIEAADDHVLQIVRDALESLMTGADDGVEHSLADILARLPVARYLAHLLIRDSPRAATAFASLRDFSTALMHRMDAAGMVGADVDREHLATVLLANDLSIALLRERITETTGEDPLSPAGLERWRYTAGRLYVGAALRPPEGGAAGDPEHGAG